MSNIIKFPNSVAAPILVATPSISPSSRSRVLKVLAGGFVAVLGIIFLLLSTPIRWALSFMTFYYFVMMFFSFNLTNATGFGLSFALLVALIHFLSRGRRG